MKVCIYRGTHEIGGNCIEIATDKTRILLDVGIPLISMKEKAPLTKYKIDAIHGLYADQKPEIDAIFITHSHPDHYGMLPLVNPKIPIYASKVAYQIIKVLEPIKKSEAEIAQWDALTINEIAPEQTIQVGSDLQVTAYPVDHTSGAMAYKITDGKTTVVYTGDIRFHSNQSWKSSKLASVAKNPDYLIMEGTHILPADAVQSGPSEDDVRRSITDLLSRSGRLAFICMSTQNVERIASVISACSHTKRQLVVSPYMALALDIYNKHVSARVPTVFTARNKMIRVYYPKYSNMLNNMKARGFDDVWRDYAIEAKEIINNPENFVVQDITELTRRLLTDKYGDNKVHDYDYIYSMWHGYIERQKTWNRYKDNPNIFHELHASGHAWASDLQDFVTKINPRVLIPVHTEYPDIFADTFNNISVKILTDNQVTEIYKKGRKSCQRKQFRKNYYVVRIVGIPKISAHWQC